MLVNLSPLTETMRDALRRLVEQIAEHDGISPVNESALLGIEGLRDADFFFMGLRSDPYGFVVVDERDKTLLVGVHPGHRGDGVATELLAEALANYPGYSVWAFGTLPGATELATRAGLTPVRALLRMKRPLGAIAVPAAPEGYRITTYRPEFREQVVAVNAAAFAHHPEQGRLTVAEFDQLTAQPWFDPAGLFVAVHGDEVVGFHWTKRHGGGLGEVYVIAVAPGHEGRGLGAVLLAAGLSYLHGHGDDRVQLYVEGDQERVVRMYRNAGFEVAQVDTSFRMKETPQ